MEPNNQNQDSKSSFLRVIKRFIFEIPVENYDKYYKTGKIQKMSQDEKIQMTVQQSIESQKFEYFKRIINIRPAILDNEDIEEVLSQTKRSKYQKYGVLTTSFLLFSYATYQISFKKELRFIIQFMKLSIVVFGVYFYFQMKENVFYTKLYRKYEKVIDYNKMRDVVLRSQNSNYDKLN